VTRRVFGKPNGLRGCAAALGVFAILFQALLFGWHHHPEHFAIPGQWPILSAQHAPLSPAAADDECEICIALHYLTAAPAEFVAAALPASTVSPTTVAATRWLVLSLDLAFHARAPPRA
jgi:hypothetical protein